jgi:hypothetical protein
MDTNLDTSDWRLWVMCVIILGCLAFWLAAVFLAARNPGHRNGGTAIKGPVQGGRHIPVGGRSVDTTVAMPAQRAESPADEAQPTGRP